MSHVTSAETPVFTAESGDFEERSLMSHLPGDRQTSQRRAESHQKDGRWMEGRRSGKIFPDADSGRKSNGGYRLRPAKTNPSG
jgi:hypothetical protein